MSATHERTCVIRARPDVVFRFFTETPRWAAWWGEGSRIDPRPGGEMYIRYPNAAVARGEVVEIGADRIVFTFGYEDPKQPIRPGGSTVELSVAPHPEGTLLTLRHTVETEAIRDQHVAGWRYQLAVFANVAARDAHERGGQAIAAWFDAWNTDDEARRRDLLAGSCVPDVVFREAWAALAGLDDLVAHIGIVRRMVAATLEAGSPRFCQGTALVDWKAGEKTRGTNVFDLDADGRIARVVGLSAG